MSDTQQKVKKKLSERDKKVLIIVASVLIIALAYFFGFAKFQEKKAALVEENTIIQTEVNELRNMVANKDTVEADTEEKIAQYTEKLNLFPSEVRTQNAIYQLDILEGKTDSLSITAEGFTMNQTYFENGVAADGTVADVNATADTEVIADAENYTGYRSDISVNYTADYDALKAVIDYVNSNPDRMTISDISISKEDGKSDMNCSMTVSMYAIAGNNKDYEKPDITGIGFGKDNIFE